MRRQIGIFGLRLGESAMILRFRAFWIWHPRCRFACRCIGNRPICLADQALRRAPAMTPRGRASWAPLPKTLAPCRRSQSLHASEF